MVDGARPTAGEYDWYDTPPRVSPTLGYQEQLAEVQAVRPCIVAACPEAVPCPIHGKPVEDRGGWLWGR